MIILRFMDIIFHTISLLHDYAVDIDAYIIIMKNV